MTTENISDDVLLTPKAVAVRFGIHELTLNNWRAQNRGPRFVRIGRLIRYPQSAIREYLASSTVQP